ncbi:acetyltransferase [Psychrobacter sp. I-STPA6b]|uniref:acetyltransferase n=1 Tax=Psychrobacter sp. I-STPA6b TaxID=2585718 RepID=UPI001D0C02F1|nr:acetyltransferase [Psychrobacter sp. I-STPA6b]
MTLKNFYQKLHHTSPTLGKAVSFATATGVIATNSIGGALPLWLMGTTKVFTGSQVADDTVIKIAKHWINSNNAVIDIALPERDWRIEMPTDLDENKQYLLICNHQSWVDTSIVQYISQDRLPLTRFFTKHSLLYLPIVGQAFYFLDFPMMRRHSKKRIASNPELKEQNLIEAKRACELLKDKPFTLLNYLEGTRFNKKKHQLQHSPYQHLLTPRAGGLSLAIRTLGHQIDGILDMTIVYPDGIPNYVDLWKGDIKRLGVHMRRIDMPEALYHAIEQGGYDNDEATKQSMFAWLDQVWQQKDERISQILKDFQSSS